MPDRPKSSAALRNRPVDPARRTGAGRLRVDQRFAASSASGEADILRLIGQVYDAAIGGEAWGTVVTSLRDLLGGESGALFPGGYAAPADGAVHVGCDLAFIHPFNDHYHRLSPLVPMLPRLPAGSVFTNHMLVPEHAYTRTEFYHDHIRPQGKYSGVFWLGGGLGRARTYVCLWRQRWQPGWEPATLRVLDSVGRHLARALEIQRRLAGTMSGRADADLLAPQERACLAGVARGGTSKQIAQRLSLSMHTVNAYLASARRKLKASSRSEAVAMALSAGLIDG